MVLPPLIPQGLRAGESGARRGLCWSKLLGAAREGDTSQKSLKKGHWHCASGAELDLGYSDLASEEDRTPQKAPGLQAQPEVKA